MKRLIKIIVEYQCEFCRKRFEEHEKKYCEKHELKCIKRPLTKIEET